MIGRVKCIKPSHYGFILDEDGKEYFFHSQHYKGDWEELAIQSPPVTNVGPEVQFKVTSSPKGLRAERVELIPHFE